MKPRVLRHSLGIMVAGLLFLPASFVAQQGLSHARVVRLSYVSGTVAIQRAGSTEWAKAMVNTPIQEGFALSTSANSFAEVEFENGSTARLGELSKVDFRQLAMDSEGNKLNHLTFEQGYATFHFIPEHSDVYTVKVADTTLTPNGKSEFRTDFSQGRLRVEVFSGSVEVTAPSGSAKLGKDKVLEYNTQTTVEALSIHQGIEEDSWDRWVEARDTQSQLALKDQAVRLHRSLYGWDDLDEYGEWAYIPGFGYGWAPYEPLGWLPYSMGLWNWYPGFGWTWISGEPWGWLPYHYGLWNFDPTFGWFWMPGSFASWSPALVSWYMGPGWIGWAPYGVGAQPGLNCVTAVSGSVVQNGQPINPQKVLRFQPRQGTPVNRPTFQATRLAMLSGVPLAQNVVLPGRAVNARAAGVQTSLNTASSLAAGADTPVTHSRIEATSAPHTSTFGIVNAHSTPAPATVLMGGDPATESALINSHPSFWERHFGGSQLQPLRTRLGTTLGGHFPASGGVGRAGGVTFGGAPEIGRGRGMNAPRGVSSSHGFSRPAPTVLSHAGSAGFSRGGGGTMRGGSEGAAHGGGGGFSTGMSGHTSAGTSSGAHNTGGNGGHH